MRIPGRVRISWQDDETLRIETDQGMQTRSLRFGVPAAASEPSSRQGYSVANWEPPAQGIGQPDAFGLFSGRIGRQPRSLEVTTTNLLPGYLRRNGPPYSPDAVLQEYFDHHVQPSGDEWFTVTTVVTDPTYLTGAFITSSDFRKEPNDDGFDPGSLLGEVSDHEACCAGVESRAFEFRGIRPDRLYRGVGAGLSRGCARAYSGTRARRLHGLPHE